MVPAARALRSLLSRSLPARARRVQAVFHLLLVVNAIDLSTSWLPTFFDTVVQPRPDRATAALQLTLLAPLVWYARHWPWRRVARAWSALPIPLVPRAALSAVIVIQLCHVALRMECYPFSSVAMFSNVVDVPANGSYRTTGYVIAAGGDVELLRLLREGNPIFARHFEWDYKFGWLLRMYKGTPAADAVVAEAARSVGLPPPKMATITYDSGNGQLRSLVPWSGR
jgi:hypothetical protein